MSKVIEKKKHDRRAGGFDLLIERDAGNAILILMGNGKVGLKDWKRLQAVCDEVIENINEMKKTKRWKRMVKQFP